MTIVYSDIITIDVSDAPSNSLAYIAWIDQALNEIQQTDEGQELFAKIQTLDGALTITTDPSDPLGAIASGGVFVRINIPQEFFTTGSFFGANGALGPQDIQRFLIHELFHTIDYASGGTEAHEARAIQFENEFMAKYYGEDRRLIHGAGDLTDNGLTDVTDPINHNFNAAGYASYEFIGKSGENLLSLLDNQDEAEFQNDANNYFYKVVNALNGITEDTITSEYEQATNTVLATGRSGDNTLDTGATKVIYGFTGNDSITVIGNERIVYAGEDNDTIYAGDGTFNALDGGTGIDTLSYVQTSAGVDVDLNFGITSFTGGGFKDTFNNIENVAGSIYDDTLIGNGDDNRLAGGFGNDTYIFSNSFGNDTINDIDGLGHILINSDTVTGEAHQVSGTQWTIGSYNATFDGAKFIINAGSGNQITIENFDAAHGALGITLGAGNDITDALNGNTQRQIVHGGDGRDFFTLHGANDNDRCGGIRAANDNHQSQTKVAV